ncbi:MAG: prefoldin subunit alpha [Nanoarchaeota archaeon]|nr:prefoldin subunit alpha [Nanoarchaeota archaeon]
MADQKELNEKYFELQILEQQLKQVNQQLLGMDNQLLELQRIKENLDDIAHTKKDTEMLVALGGGVFSKAELKDSSKVLMNVGSNIVVEKDIASSKVVVDHQMGQITEVIKQLEQEFQILAMNSQVLQQDLQKMIGEMKEPKQ